MLDVNKMVDAVLDAVDAPLRSIAGRVKALEDRQPERGEPGKDGADGKDADMDAIREMIAAEVKAAVEAIPAPKDGADGKDGRDGIDGKDGVGLAGAVINREGELVLTLTDGTAKELGPVAGRNGEKGEPGKDGADGFGFDDLEVIQSGVKDFTFRFTKGERVKEFGFSLPVVTDCGVFKDGSIYQPGDGVTWGGSFWIAQGGTKEKPGTGEGWRLAVKKGRDGKDGKLVEAAPKTPIKVGPGKKDDAQ